MGRNKLLLWLLAALLLLAVPARAGNPFDYTVFQKLPVVHEGRLKPMGRMAQLLLKDISNLHVSIDEATPWLVELLFDPQSADEPPIFYVPQGTLPYVLGLPERAESYYSFTELNDAFMAHKSLILGLREQASRKLSAEQQALLALYARVTYYEQLKGAMTLLLPLKAAPDKNFTNLYPRKKTPVVLMLLSSGKNNQSLRILPEQTPLGVQWQSPWENFLQQEKLSPLLGEWQKAASAYIRHDTDAWREQIADIYRHTLEQADMPSLDTQLRAEILYIKSQPYFLSMMLYAAGVLAALGLRRRGVAIASVFLSGGLVLHGFGMACRMMILQRPPVSNLYESVLFVGFLMMVMGLAFAWRKKERVLLAPLAGLGILLHLTGFGLNDEGESLKVLQAVLDTKFWLATHVIIITSGYAVCLLTSVLAHVCLAQNAHKPVELARTKMFRTCIAFSLASLLLVSTGTLLGGVWADQSWGRFWGWDPKENGALLIALWLVWLLHGRYSRDVSNFWFIAGLAALSLVVALSWIGVNLLGIGLHSYGFISGSASGLIGLFSAELAFLGWCLWRRKNHAAA